MWSLKNNPFVQPVPSSAESIPLPSIEAQGETLVFQERPPIKQVVKQLLLLSHSQWRAEPSSTVTASNFEGYTANLHSGARVSITRQVSSSLPEGELLKTTYQLFIDQERVGSYFEYIYVGGGQIIGGDFSICELYSHIAQVLSEDQNNSREWRAAKEDNLPRRSKPALG